MNEKIKEYIIHEPSNKNSDENTTEENLSISRYIIYGMLCFGGGLIVTAMIIPIMQLGKEAWFFKMAVTLFAIILYGISGLMFGSAVDKYIKFVLYDEYEEDNKEEGISKEVIEK